MGIECGALGSGALFSMERNVTDQEKREATLHQASHLMQAGISASLADDIDEARKFFTGAVTRFEALDNRTNAGIARGWLEGLQERQRLESLATPDV
jgi:hypothetical protein